MKRALTLWIAAMVALGALALYAQFSTNRPGVRTNIAPAWTTNRPGRLTNLAPAWTTNRPAVHTLVYWQDAPILQWAYGTNIVPANTNIVRAHAALIWSNTITFYQGGAYELQAAPTNSATWASFPPIAMYGDFRQAIAFFTTNNAWPHGSLNKPIRSRVRYVLDNLVSRWSNEVTNTWPGP